MLLRHALCLCLATAAFAHPDDAMPVRKIAAAAPLPAAPLGSGAWRFEIEAGWAKVPEGSALGPTHGGIVIDRAGLIYMSSDGPLGILVFSPDGKFLRGIAPEFSGVHGLMLRTEGGKEFIYAAHLRGNQVVKLSLDGKPEWTIGVPKESGFYNQPADAKKQPQAYRPTAIAVGPDDRIYVADGYGASVIHLYSADRKYVRTIGTKGAGDGQFSTCHGLAIDTRSGRPLLLVADRANRRLVHLDLEGNFVRTLTTGLRLPCAVSIRGDYAAVAELEGRVVVTDKDGAIVATLGDNPDQKQWAQFRLAPDLWKDGIFIAPHGLAFDADGNLFVQDWNYIGRLTKLRRAPKSVVMAP
jgi:outer membrane protein assembly factor BamB